MRITKTYFYTLDNLSVA